MKVRSASRREDNSNIHRTWHRVSRDKLIQFATAKPGEEIRIVPIHALDCVSSLPASQASE